MLGSRKVSRGLSVPLDCLGHDGFAEPSGAPGRLTMQDIGRFDRFFSAASAPLQTLDGSSPSRSTIL